MLGGCTIDAPNHSSRSSVIESILSAPTHTGCAHFGEDELLDVQVTPDGPSVFLVEESRTAIYHPGYDECEFVRRQRRAAFADIARNGESMVFGYSSGVRVSDTLTRADRVELYIGQGLANASVLDAALSDDGRYLLVVQQQGTSTIRNVQEGFIASLKDSHEFIPLYSGLRPGFFGVSRLSPDSKSIVIGTRVLRKFGIWDQDGGLLRHTVDTPEGRLLAGEFLDNVDFLGVSDTNMVFVLNTVTGDLRTKFSLSEGSPVTSISVDRVTRTLFTGHANGIIAAWDIDAGNLMASVQASDVAIGKLSVSLRSNFGFWWDIDKTFGELHVVAPGTPNLASGPTEITCAKERSDKVHDVQFSPSGDSIVIMLDSWTAAIDASSFRCQSGIRHEVSDFGDLAEDTEHMAIGYSRKVNVVSARDQVQHYLYLHNEVKLPAYKVLDTTLSQDGQWVLVVQAGGKSSVWNVASQSNVTLERSSSIVSEYSYTFSFRGVSEFSPDAETIVIGTDYNGRIGVWSRKDGALVHTVTTPSGTIRAGKFVDDEHFLGITDTREVFIFSTVTGETVNVFTLPVVSPVTSMSLDRDSRTLFTGHANGMIAAWNYADNRALARVQASDRAIEALAVHVPSDTGIWWDQGNRFGKLQIVASP